MKIPEMETEPHKAQVDQHYAYKTMTTYKVIMSDIR